MSDYIDEEELQEDDEEYEEEPSFWGLISFSDAVRGALFLMLTLIFLYMFYYAQKLAKPEYSYESVLLATVSDIVEADGVLIFEETTVSGGGELGYIAVDGERVSRGSSIAEIYTSETQGQLRTRLKELNAQIDLLERSQNISVTQIDTLVKDRTASLYTLMEQLDRSSWESVSQGKEDFLLAQNKLRIATGDVTDFSAQIAQFRAEAAAVRAQLGDPTQITSPLTGYFISAQNARTLNRPAEELRAMSPAELQEALRQGVDSPMQNCVGKVITSFKWSYYGVCSAEEGEKLLTPDGTPLKSKLKLRFPGRMESDVTVRLTEVTIDREANVTRFALDCESVNADVLKLGQAKAQLVVANHTGFRVRASAVRLELEKAEDGSGEYRRGVYVRYGNIARFCVLDPVDETHPQVRDGEYLIVTSTSAAGEGRKLRLYDEVILTGHPLSNGKLL